jgi:hypothetical protein
LFGATLDPRRAAGPPALMDRIARRWASARRSLEQRRRV